MKGFVSIIDIRGHSYIPSNIQSGQSNSFNIRYFCFIIYCFCFGCNYFVGNYYCIPDA